MIWHEDEPIVWPSSVSLYFVARLARERVTVVLTGEGSDETLAGYTRYAWTLLNARMDGLYRCAQPSFPAQDGARRQFSGTVVGAAAPEAGAHVPGAGRGVLAVVLLRQLLFRFLGGRAGRNCSRSEAQGVQAMPTPDRCSIGRHSSGDLLHRMLYTDIKTYLVELLMKQDQMSMAASIESRVPFLDHELVEFTATIPARYDTKGLAGKFILKSAVEDLLPKDIIYRQKMGFPTPWAYWLAGPQLESLEQMLLSPRTVDRGHFNADVVQATLRGAPRRAA